MKNLKAQIDALEKQLIVCELQGRFTKVMLTNIEYRIHDNYAYIDWGYREPR